jgi:two-component system OmpR family response regulator
MTNKPHLLIVEDDDETRELIQLHLEGRGFRVTAVANGAQMKRALESGDFSLILLDLMLPGEGGLSLCRTLRNQKSATPIIMLTALGEPADRIVGLDSGADDYVSKPFSPRELVARIGAVLRRTRSATAATGEKLGFAGYVLDLARRALLDPLGAEVELTAGEYDLLVALAQRPRRVLNRDQLIELTHGPSAAPFDRSVDVHVSRLRCKLRLTADAPDIIRTVRYGGYMFAADIVHAD